MKTTSVEGFEKMLKRKIEKLKNVEKNREIGYEKGIRIKASRETLEQVLEWAKQLDRVWDDVYENEFLAVSQFREYSGEKESEKEDED